MYNMQKLQIFAALEHFMFGAEEITFPTVPNLRFDNIFETGKISNFSMPEHKCSTTPKNIDFLEAKV